MAGRGNIQHRPFRVPKRLALMNVTKTNGQRFGSASQPSRSAFHQCCKEEDEKARTTAGRQDWCHQRGTRRETLSLPPISRSCVQSMERALGSQCQVHTQRADADSLPWAPPVASPPAWPQRDPAAAHR